ncbi:MAG: hypothetical protein CMM84_19625 [Rhodothermaceae bacterium]|nr:hypothetical protein [Rhodothermaceae bacterium]MBC12435.1 hypothetical protein [Rhodothermaceae bacterium]
MRSDPPPFTDGESLLIPLYHGTSSLFLPSIIEHGLGGRNPVGEYRAHDALRLALSVCDVHLVDDEEWVYLVRPTAVRMLGGEVTAGGFNFRHGAPYLSPSRRSATSYATSNKYGSEIISYAALLIERAAAASPGVPRSPFESYHT